MTQSVRSIFPLAVAFSAAVFAATAMAEPVPYPDGYRHWHHVKSMVIGQDHPLADPFAGIHHVYANDLALQGLGSGSHDDGSILVFDLLEAQEGDGVLTEGSRKLVGVMVKSRNVYPDTGGWGFEGFAGDSREQRLTNDGGQACFSCHLPQAEQDYVFSDWRR